MQILLLLWQYYAARYDSADARHNQTPGGCLIGNKGQVDGRMAAI